MLAQSAPSIADIPIELGPRVTLPLGKTIRFEMATTNQSAVVNSLKDWTDIDVAKSEQTDGLLVSMSERPVYIGELLERHSKSSWVIDIEESSTQEFIWGFEKDITDISDLSLLPEYVDAFIDNPSYIHGFNIASVVAAQRSGDCTEYAVLTAALARAKGIPSRVVLGTVIFELDNHLNAVGHAWVEVWFQDQWHTLDAALYQMDVTSMFYLPAASLQNEGPGFAFSLITATSLFPSKITLVENQ